MKPLISLILAAVILNWAIITALRGLFRLVSWVRNSERKINPIRKFVGGLKSLPNYICSFHLRTCGRRFLSNGVNIRVIIKTVVVYPAVGIVYWMAPNLAMAYTIIYFIFFSLFRRFLKIGLSFERIVLLSGIVLFITTLSFVALFLPVLTPQDRVHPGMWIIYHTNEVLIDLLDTTKFLRLNSGFVEGLFGRLSGISLYIQANLAAFLFLSSISISLFFFRYIAAIFTPLELESKENMVAQSPTLTGFTDKKRNDLPPYWIIRLPKYSLYILFIPVIASAVLTGLYSTYTKSVILVACGIYFLAGFCLMVYFFKGGNYALNSIIFVFALTNPVTTWSLIALGILDNLLDLRKVAGLFLGDRS